ncbi:hypothetical protein KVR01_000471 [Diaporthe batatas]|uniref:uncharacterized protein n=1 Tax=Diaporthe batatas TaxID=748121 RepID=UPI001D05240C|nr:uncharacterized protein KVR01_000471 [Diaporthe batatas]KAG8169726.1 hypothetical protein KVR01_000471 [Diaporthe batatas]
MPSSQRSVKPSENPKSADSHKKRPKQQRQIPQSRHRHLGNVHPQGQDAPDDNGNGEHVQQGYHPQDPPPAYEVSEHGSSLREVRDAAYNAGYNAAIEDGFDAGVQNGYDRGVKDGYAWGFKEGSQKEGRTDSDAYVEQLTMGVTGGEIHGKWSDAVWNQRRSQLANESCACSCTPGVVGR